jgi:hypothetical protein
MNRQTVADALEFAPVIGVANLTMFSLVHGDETVPGYATLDEAGEVGVQVIGFEAA